jgi:Arc/MetJ-type ribon-helix-helix transcriptional regulator
MCIFAFMSQSVTTRLDEDVVQAIDEAVTCGIAPNRGAIISRAVREWLSRHSEEAIKDSYRKRYQALDPDEQDLIARLASISAAICIADNNK